MPIVIFNFSRKLKISRFTIDVLIERLEKLKPRTPAGVDCAGLIGQTQATVAACDKLHNELRDRFESIRARDARGIASWTLRFEELHRKIGDSITRLNLVQYGDASS